MEEEDYSLNYELYENELRLKDMYFGVTKPIKLTDIYSEVNKLKDKDDMRFIFWKDDKYIRVQKCTINRPYTFFVLKDLY